MDLIRQTRLERRAQLNGVNLFFGALLGANLGMLDDMQPSRYLVLIILVASTVLSIQLLPGTDRKLLWGGSLATTMAVLTLMLGTPAGDKYFVGMEDRPGLNMLITLYVWLFVLAVVQLTPLREEQRKPARRSGPPDPDGTPSPAD